MGVIMYGLLIVDDEDTIRNGLAHTIDWNSMGFKVVGTASNGRKVLEMLGELNPDVILADIRMPGLSGVELAKKVARDNPDVFVVILTGFDQFEYAKEAIDYNVFSYLLKPYSNKVLQETFGKLKTILDKRNDERNISHTANQALLNKELRVLISEEVLPVDFMILDKWLDLLDSISIYLFIETDKDIIKSLLKKIERKVISYFNNKGQVWIVTDKVHKTIENIITGLVDKDRSGFSKWHGLYGSFPNGSSNILPVVSRIKQLGEEVIFGCSGIYDIDSIQGDIAITAKGSLLTHSDIRKIVSAITDGNMETLEKVFDEIALQDRWNSLFDKHTAVESNKENLEELWRSFSLANILDKTKAGKVQSFMDKLKEFNSIESIYNNLFTLIREIAENTEIYKLHTTNPIIKNVFAIIQQRYMDDLSLDILADELKLSSPYLSRLFKKETGINFKDYLKNHRINLAKYKLKNTTMKIYEISESVGYRDQTYFSDLFKKTVGCSPIKYKNMNTGID